jgi:hypothetical protein
MTGTIRTTPFEGPMVWTGGDFAADGSWLHVLSDGELADIRAAVAGLSLEQVSNCSFCREDFPLPVLSSTLHRIAAELEDGHGFALLRGLPVDALSETEYAAMCFGLGLHMGKPVRQNPRGDLLGMVAHTGDVNDRQTRVYQTNLYLPYHSDPSDVVGLFCIRKAREGGLSSLVSVAAIYNRILAEFPAYLGLYHRQWYFSHLCEDLPSLSPIFSYHAGKLSCRYLRQYIELGHDIRKLPLSRVEVEALDIFDAVMSRPELRLDMMLEPGDLQFANNYAVLHSRTAFTDHDDLAMRREMWRLWIKMDNARELAPDFPGRNGFPDPAAVAA